LARFRSRLRKRNNIASSSIGKVNLYFATQHFIKVYAKY
jgi:hypothetical protein